MKAVYWLLLGLLAGRPGPGEIPWDLEELWAGGLRTILSLSDEVDEEAIAAVGFHHGQFYFPPIFLFVPSVGGGELSEPDGTGHRVHPSSVGRGASHLGPLPRWQGPHRRGLGWLSYALPRALLRRGDPGGAPGQSPGHECAGVWMGAGIVRTVA
jgi:hypothetical protein